MTNRTCPRMRVGKVANFIQANVPRQNVECVVLQNRTRTWLRMVREQRGKIERVGNIPGLSFRCTTRVFSRHFTPDASSAGSPKKPIVFINSRDDEQHQSVFVQMNSDEAFFRSKNRAKIIEKQPYAARFGPHAFF